MVDAAGVTRLSPGAVETYLRCLADGEYRQAARSHLGQQDALTVILEELESNHLLQRSPEDGRLIPVSPEAAAEAYALPIESQIADRRADLAHARERLLNLMPAYLSSRMSGPASEGLELVSDPVDVQKLVMEESAACTKDMMTVHPGNYRDPEALEAALPAELAAVGRGVRFRAIYQHTTRTQLSLHPHVRAITEAGAEVRTVDQVVERMFVFDAAVAFIPSRTNDGRPPGALVVRQPILVAFLCALFEQSWDSGTPYLTDGPGYGNVSDDLRRAILRLLALDHKDEAVARRLGISARTCRRHISELMKDLGVESRFAAGVKAAQLGLVNPDEQSADGAGP